MCDFVIGDEDCVIYDEVRFGMKEIADLLNMKSGGKHEKGVNDVPFF